MGKRGKQRRRDRRARGGNKSKTKKPYKSNNFKEFYVSLYVYIYIYTYTYNNNNIGNLY